MDPQLIWVWRTAQLWLIDLSQVGPPMSIVVTKVVDEKCDRVVIQGMSLDKRVDQEDVGIQVLYAIRPVRPRELRARKGLTSR